MIGQMRAWRSPANPDLSHRPWTVLCTPGHGRSAADGLRSIQHAEQLGRYACLDGFLLDTLKRRWEMHLMQAVALIPSITGMLTSIKTTCGRNVLTASIPALPSAASPTTCRSDSFEGMDRTS